MRIVHIQIALTHDVEEISIEKLIYGLFLWNNNFFFFQFFIFSLYFIFFGFFFFLRNFFLFT